MSVYVRGEIFYDVFFFYRNENEHCEKLLLVLNKNHIAGQDVVVVPAATHKTKYVYKNGCNKSERVHYFEKCVGYYRDKTLIQYDFIERIKLDEFERRITSKQMKRQNKNISDAELQAILQCLKSIKEDIEDEVMELIF